MRMLSILPVDFWCRADTDILYVLGGASRASFRCFSTFFWKTASFFR